MGRAGDQAVVEVYLAAQAVKARVTDSRVCAKDVRAAVH